MKIFLDFDDVVFNAKKFKRDLIKIFLKNGVTRSEFENSYYTFSKKAQEWGYYYEPQKQVQVLKRRDSINRKKLKKDIDAFMEDLSKYVFGDFYDFMNHFNKKDLYLITYGHTKFQMQKIMGSGIRKFFKKVIISKRNKIDDIMETLKREKIGPEEEIFFIEDRPEQVEEAKKTAKRVKCFHMCRPEGRYSDLACESKDFEVRNLNKTLKIIKKALAK